MLRYVETAVVMAEVPDEITLAINIAGCPIHCPDCHSKYLWEDKGIELTYEELKRLINENIGITCIAFMGGDQNPCEINSLAIKLRAGTGYKYRLAWYSGRELLPAVIELSLFNYIKLGPYKKEFGPLNKRTTNQRFYEVVPTRELDENDDMIYGLSDITERFWK